MPIQNQKPSGVTQEHLAWLSGTSQGLIANVLGGRRRPGRFVSLKLGYALGVDWRKVMTSTGPQLKRMVDLACQDGTLATIPWRGAPKGKEGHK